jgi:hypothetical protein
MSVVAGERRIATNANAGHTFARFGPHWRRAAITRPDGRRGGRRHMSDGTSLLAAIDRICGQFASTLQHSELQIYATIALVVVLSVLLFPPKDDPDQV